MGATTALERPETGHGPFVRGPFLGLNGKHKRPRMGTLLCFLLGFVGPDGSGTPPERETL